MNACVGERVGVVGKKGGKFAVIEYTEMKEEDTKLVDDQGKLVYGAGNVCNHFYSVEFLEKVPKLLDINLDPG